MRLRRVLRGFVMSCGCVGGAYERYDDRIVHIIDESGDGCTRPDHRNGALVHENEDESVLASAGGRDEVWSWQHTRR